MHNLHAGTAHRGGQSDASDSGKGRAHLHDDAMSAQVPPAVSGELDEGQARVPGVQGAAASIRDRLNHCVFL